MCWYAGCRISEALGLASIRSTPSVWRSHPTLKRRRVVFRVVPVPQAVIDQAHTLRRCGRPVLAYAPRFRLACRESDDASGRHRRPDGLPKGYGTASACAPPDTSPPTSFSAGWARLSSHDRIYVDAVGIEERQFASRMW